MPNSLKCRLEKLAYQGLLSEKDLNRIIVIPNNATNEKVIKTIFPISREKYTNYGTIKVCGIDCELPIEFLADWWNETYKLSELKGENE